MAKSQTELGLILVLLLTFTSYSASLSLSFLICKMEMKPFVQMRIEIRYHKMLLPIYSIWSLLITCSMFPFLIIHFYEFIYHIVFAV